MSMDSDGGSGWVRVVSTTAMSTARRHRFSQAFASGLALAFVAAAVFLGCSKEAPAKEEPRSPQGAGQPGTEVTPAAVTPEGEEPSGAGQASYSEATFDLKIQPKGAYKVGQPGEAEVVLSAKGPYKCNDKYPYKLKLDDAAGLKFPDKVIKKEAVKLEKTKAVMTVAFTPESAGSKTLGGLFSFSVCTDDKCLIEKRKLALDIKVD